jgi:hypothetical protein
MATNLLLTELDFDGIKANIKNFLKNQTEFTDYNFEGSALSTLIDILAYNTYMLSYYTNMVANESFLDTAIKRENVISHAKLLGYTPRSTRSSSTILNVTSSVNQSVSRNSYFTADVDGVGYYFSPVEDISLTANVPQSIVVYEGKTVTNKFLVNLTDITQKFVIPNSEIDTSTLKVSVQQNATSGSEVYTLNTNLTTVEPDSKIYYLEEDSNYNYRILFGDGILGKALESGNVITVEYKVSAGAAANGATSFTPPQNITINSSVTSFGGSSRESTDSIKFIAPRNFEGQNRAVTTTDYRTLILRDVPNVEAVSVWGGQDQLTHPVYGKVFIAIKPVGEETLNSLQKASIKNTILNTKNIVSVIPELVDPKYIYLKINTKLVYDRRKTTLTKNEVVSKLKLQVNLFAQKELSNFETSFRYSKFLYLIDNVDAGIISNITNISLVRKNEVTLNTINKIEISFNNRIKTNSIISNGFVVSQDPTITYNSGDVFFLDDDGLGVIRIIRYQGGNKIVMKNNIGTVNYETGSIIIESILPSSLIETTLNIEATPYENDILAKREDIILLNPENFTVTAEDLDAR